MITKKYVEDITEMDALKKAAADLNVTYQVNIGFLKLKERILNLLAKQESSTKAVEVNAESIENVDLSTITDPTKLKQIMRLRSEKLVRIILSPREPNELQDNSKLITIANSHIGAVRRVIPYNVATGWHVPYIIYNYLKSATMNIHTTETDPETRQKIRVVRKAPKYGITVLPDLTDDEIAHMANVQANLAPSK